MDFLAYQNRVKNKIGGKNSASGFWSPDHIKEEINSAIIWVCGQYEFSILKKTFKKATLLGLQYYSYPKSPTSPYTVKQNSSTFLYIDGVPYDKVRYDQFLKYKSLQTNDSSVHIYAENNNKIFIYPTPTATGLIMEMDGSVFPLPLVNDTDLPVIDGDSELEEIAIKKAVETLIAEDITRKDYAIYKTSSIEDIIAVKNRLNKAKSKDTMIFSSFGHTDFISGNSFSSENNIGNFNK